MEAVKRCEGGLGPEVVDDPIVRALQPSTSERDLLRGIGDYAHDALDMTEDERRGFVDVQARHTIAELRLQLAVVQAELALCRKYGNPVSGQEPVITFNEKAAPGQIEEAARAIAEARRATDELKAMERISSRPAYVPLHQVRKMVERVYAAAGCRVLVCHENLPIVRLIAMEMSEVAKKPEALHRFWKVGPGWVADLEKCPAVQTAELLECPYVLMDGRATADELDVAKTRQYFEVDFPRQVLKRVVG